MARRWVVENSDRLRAALATACLQAIFGYALIHAFSVSMPFVTDTGIKLFDLAADRPPPPIRTVSSPVKKKKPRGAASPQNLKGRATEIVAPVPTVILQTPPLLTVSKVPDVDTGRTTGASNFAGPGTGSGGLGNGRGSGGNGDGTGSGTETPLRWLKGRLKDSDYPEAASRAGIGGMVAVRFTVGTDGRVNACFVTQSSGNADLDGTTCRLIKERYRYEPPMDADGRALTATVVEEHEWIPHPH
jgi:periplasmic protein TonB